MNLVFKKAVFLVASMYVTLIYTDNRSEVVLPASFGRTHFIVGMSPADLSLLREANNQTSQEPQGEVYRRAYFSPDDGLEKRLIELIEHERLSIKIAVFQFTNGEIARAVKRAQQRGVHIEIVTDPLCLQDKFNKIAWLSKEGLAVYVYNPDPNKSALSNKMHNKFVIFGKNIDGKNLVWIGSFNFTKSADIANQESVVVLDDSNIINQFNKQYTQLKGRALKLDDFAKNHIVIQAWHPKDKNITGCTEEKQTVAHNKTVCARKRNKTRKIATT